MVPGFARKSIALIEGVFIGVLSVGIIVVIIVPIVVVCVKGFCPCVDLRGQQALPSGFNSFEHPLVLSSRPGFSVQHGPGVEQMIAFFPSFGYNATILPKRRLCLLQKKPGR